MARYALIDSNNLVQNVIVYEPPTEYSVPKEFLFINVDDVFCGPGFVYNPKTQEFTAPNPPIPDFIDNASAAQLAKILVENNVITENDLATTSVLVSVLVADETTP